MNTTSWMPLSCGTRRVVVQARSMSFVFVLHQARQYKIQCTPGKIVNEILLEACVKAGLEGNSYGLRHGKSNLDLSLPFRLARLPAGAKLDLVRVSLNDDTQVNVALNVQGYPRRTAMVPAGHSLWQILQVFESQNSSKDLDLTSHASLREDGLAYKDQCVVQLNNKEYGTDETLKNTTLSSIGIKNGSAVLKVTLRSTTFLMGETSQGKPLDQIHLPDGKTMIDGDQSLSDTTQVQDTTTLPEDRPASLPSPIHKTLKAREVEVLVPSSSTAPHHSATQVDSTEDLKMSVDQAKSYQASLIARAQISQGPLLTQKLRERQAVERKLRSRPEKCRVKFKFMDGTQVIGTFDPTEAVDDLYTFTQTLVSNPQTPFILERLGDKQKLDRLDAGELWKDWSFGSGIALQVVPTTDARLHVKDEYRAMGKDVSEVVASNSPDTTLQNRNLEEEKKGSEGANGANDSTPKEKKIPKWLQKTLGKK